jgi:4'-phosphopantetheinyl transferase
VTWRGVRGSSRNPFKAGTIPAHCEQAECGVVETVSSKILSLFARDAAWPVALQILEPADPCEPPVDLWSWRIDVDAGRAGREAECLSRDELVRMEKLRTPELKLRFQAAHGRMRRILGAYVFASAAELRLQYGANGKPSIEPGARPAIHFNLTHSDRLAALAVSPARPVGIDIEVIQPVEGQVARDVFSPAEYAALEGLPEGERLRAFYRGWTRKEAVVKAIGEGLSLPLKSFDVELRPGERARILRAETFEASAWRLVDFSPALDHIGAVAIFAGQLVPASHP